MSSIYADMDLSETEEIFIELLVKTNEGKVEVLFDKTAVIVNGTNRGSFEDSKAVFPQQWADAQSAVTKLNAKETGVTYNAVVCSATSDDLLSVSSTAALMRAIPGQINIPILFRNGNTLVIADDADLAAFLAVWTVAYKNAGTGYTYNEEQ